MSSILIKNIGAIVTGDLKNPLRNANSIFIDGGIIREIGNNIRRKADRVIDADGITAMPGLIDSHSHPSIGEYTPAQNSLSWITNYMHGGVSRSGVSQLAGWEIVRKIDPDIIGHITGGPIPMPEEEMIRIAYETDYFVEICSSGNYRLALSLIRAVKARGIYHRVLIGTDTPGGTGVIPRGILREIAFMSSVGEVAPETVICMATGNVGRAHGLDIGILEEGRPADLVLLHKITGSVATDALDSFAKGDLPGISTVIIDGEIRVAGRSQQRP